MENKKVVLVYIPSEQQFLPVPPLGISVLSQHLLENKIDNDILDLELELWLNQGMKSSNFASKGLEELEINDLPVDGIVSLLKEYEIVSFSIMGKRQIPYLMAIVQKLKKCSEKLKYTIVGGAFFNKDNVKEIIDTKDKLINYAIVGEGWQPMLELLSNLLEDKRPQHVKGVAYLDEKESFVYTSEQAWDKELPMPSYSGINIEGYRIQQEKLYGIKDKNITYHILVGDRNCPYSCSFCRISKNTMKVKTPKEIAIEMIQLHDMYSANRFSLVCNEMNPSVKYLNEYLDTLLKSEKKLKWFCYLRPNNLEQKMLYKVQKAGCTMIRYGVETGSQKILDHMNKKLYVKDIDEIMKNTHNAGIWNHINIVTGYLHENEEDIQLTLDFLERNKEYIDSIRVNPFYIPINSPIHKEPDKFGVRIIDNTGSYIKFEEPDCTWEEKQKRIESSTGRVLEKCLELGIGFAGVLPFLVSTAVAHFGEKGIAKEWLKSKHSYLWNPISPDTGKWRLAHPERDDVSINKWNEIAGKRGSNYQTLMELNND